MSQFHFIRAEWLLAIIPLLLLSWMLLKKTLFSRNWQSVVDPRLLPHLLIGQVGKTRRTPVILFFIGGLISILALAGPAWEKLPQPVYKQQSALVILLDLSLSMDAADIKPSRLARARHKISDILKLRKEGQTALVGYAGEAFTISPLTDDNATIDSLVPSLDTSIMPSLGSRVDLALKKANELLLNAGINKGDILLITDGVPESFDEAFTQQHAAGHRVSILGLGTAQGGPITLADGGFLKDDNGSIVMPKLDRAGLRRLAQSAGGRFSSLSADDTDIKHLLAQLDVNRIHAERKESEMKADVWREEGPWLLLLLIPFAALAFRKGYLSLLIFCILPLPDSAEALSWDELWLNDDQRAAQEFNQNNNSEAARLFNTAEWKASAHYKAGEYEQALEQLQPLDHADAHYNRGNTLAKMGQFDEAIAAYDEAIKLQPGHDDAIHNKQQLLKHKQQNPQQDNQDQHKQADKDQQQNSADKKNNHDSSSQQGSSSPQQNDKQDSAENSAQQQKQTEQQQQTQNNDKDRSANNQHNEPVHSDSNDEKQQAQQKQWSQTEQQDALSKQASEQWLRRIPDDPGGLLRNKFRYLYQQQKQTTNESQSW